MSTPASVIIFHANGKKSAFRRSHTGYLDGLGAELAQLAGKPTGKRKDDIKVVMNAVSSRYSGLEPIKLEEARGQCYAYHIKSENGTWKLYYTSSEREAEGATDMVLVADSNPMESGWRVAYSSVGLNCTPIPITPYDLPNLSVENVLDNFGREDFEGAAVTVGYLTSKFGQYERGTIAMRVCPVEGGFNVLMVKP